MNAQPTIKFLLGLDQQPDAELAQGLTEAVNVEYDKVGSIRQSRQNVTGITYGTPVHSMALEGISSGEITLVGTGTNLYTGEVLLKSNLSGLPIAFSSQAGRIYFSTSTDGIWFYDGSLPIYKAGAPVPSSAPTVSDGGAGGSFNASTANPYTISVTFINAQGFEGNPSAAGSSPSLSSRLINLSAIPVNSNGDYNIQSRRVWIRGGTNPIYTDYVLLATIADNSTTTLTGLNSDDVDTTTVLETDNNLPVLFPMIVNHYDTMFGAGDISDRNLLYFSKTANPHAWPTAQAFRISRSGDPIMALCVWNASLWAFTKQSVYQILGSPGQGALLTNFYVKSTQSVSGTIAQRSVVPTPYGIFFEAEDGFRIFNGDTSQVFSNPIQTEFEERNIGEGPESMTVGLFGQDKLLFSYATTSEVPDRTVIYDFKTKRWSVQDLGYRSMAVDKGSRTIYGGTSTGVDLFRTAGTFDGWAIKTKDLTTNLDSYSSFGKFQVDMEGTMSAQVYLDDTVFGTYSLTNATRGFITRRFPLGLANRAAIRLFGNEGSTQAKVYSIGYSAETQRGKV